MAASSVTRYFRTKGKATRVIVWDELHARQMTCPLGGPACNDPRQRKPSCSDRQTAFVAGMQATAQNMLAARETAFVCKAHTHIIWYTKPQVAAIARQSRLCMISMSRPYAAVKEVS